MLVPLGYNVVKTMYEISTSCVRIKNKAIDYFLKFNLELSKETSLVLFYSIFFFINDLPKQLEQNDLYKKKSESLLLIAEKLSIHESWYNN